MDVQIEVDSDDEIGQLSRQFNQMVTKVRELMDNIVEKQKIQRNYELKLLNAQINPHFLYNTLDSLLWLIQIKRLDDAEHAAGFDEFFKTDSATARISFHSKQRQKMSEAIWRSRS